MRRAHSQAAPILGDQLGSLEGEARLELQAAIDELTAQISSGKFSAAWRYPELIRRAQQLYDGQSQQRLEREREQRALEGVRRKAAELLRDSGVALAADVTTKLNRELRAATDHAAINQVSDHIREAIGAARALQERRRDREIDRTRARIDRAPARTRQRAPRDADGADPADSWQDVLLKLKQQMSREEAQG